MKRALKVGTATPSIRNWLISMVLESHTNWWTYKKQWKDPPFLMAKSSISMAIFNSFLYVHQAGYQLGWRSKLGPVKMQSSLALTWVTRWWANSLQSTVRNCHTSYVGQKRRQQQQQEQEQEQEQQQQQQLPSWNSAWSYSPDAKSIMYTVVDSLHL